MEMETNMRQIVDHALCPASQNHFSKAVEKLAPRIEAYRQNPLPHFLLPQKTDDLAPMQDLAASLAEGASRLIILGTGGSSLGAQVLAQINGYLTPAEAPLRPQIIFVDNLDADSFTAILAQDLSATRFLVVSKSGNTAETLMQLGGVMLALKAAGLPLHEHIAAIVGDGDNALSTLAQRHGLRRLSHEQEIGGRFSVLTNVGLLPAIWAGCDVAAIRAGAQAVLDGFYGNAPADNQPLIGAAMHLAHMQAGRMIAVMMPYADRLQRLSFWYRQLWAESLGKNGLGSLPSNALGPVDQHSQMQLYLGGPDDKFYTLLTQPTRDRGTGVPDEFASLPATANLTGRTMGDLVSAEALASYDTLAAAKRPVRLFELSAINELELGGLLMHYMLETILAADGMAIDAFDQPEVEAGKLRARDYMQAMNDAGKAKTAE
jgi:glucose-6-phosphate isomerase